MPIQTPVTCFCEENCQPLSQIVSDDGSSFMTVCERLEFQDGSNRDKQDKYKVWFHNDQIDDVQYYDKRDLIDTMSVLAQAISIIENNEINLISSTG